jgi:hypothetical protein
MRKERKELLNILLCFYSEEGVSVTEAMDLIEELYRVNTLSAPLEVRKREFHEQCTTLLLEDRSNAQELTTFYKYWTEHPEKVKSNTKMRFERERVFNLSKRYNMWKRNSKKWSIVNMLKR